MNLTDHEFNIFLQKIKLTHNIFDLLAVLYESIDNLYSPDYIESYSEYLEKNMERMWGNAPLLIEELLSCDIDYDTFIKGFAELLTSANLSLFAVHLLKSFDQIFADREGYKYLKIKKTDSKTFSNMGPLNSNCNKYILVYLFHDKLVGKNLRTIKRKDASDIFEKISSYRIIKQNTSMPEIDIKYYKNNYFSKLIDEMQEEIKIGVVPISKDIWFKLKYKKHEKAGMHYFEIMDEDDSKIDEIND